MCPAGQVTLRALVAAMVLAACGDDAPPPKPADAAGEGGSSSKAGEKAPADGKGGAKKPAAAADAAAKPTEAEEVKPAVGSSRIGGLASEIDRTVFAEDSRDPFTAPTIEVKTGPTDGQQTQSDCDLTKEPLGNFQPNQLKLIGLITGTAAPRAMFLASAGTQAIIAQEGAKVGPRCSSEITDIRDNEVVIQQASALEEERVETVIVLTDRQLAGVLIE